MSEEINATIKGRRSEKQAPLKEENKKVEMSKESKKIKETNTDGQMNKNDNIDNTGNNEKRENIKINIKNGNTEEIRVLKIDDNTVFAEGEDEKFMNPKDKYYSVRLPKFIRIDKNIIKYKDEGEENKEENEDEGEENYLIKRESNIPVIQWQFDADRFNKMKKGGFAEIFKDEKKNESEDSFEKDEDQKKDEDRKKEEDRKKDEDRKKHKKKEDETNDEVLTNEEKKKDMKHQPKIETQKKKKNVCEIKTMDDLYKKYKIKDYKNHGVSDSDKNLKDYLGRKIIDLSENLEFLHTNSFLVEYDNGDFILFVDGKPFTLECDNEISYLIEGDESEVKPVYAKVEKRFFIKAAESPGEHRFKPTHGRRSEKEEEDEEEDVEEDEDQEDDEVYYSLTNEQEK